VLSMVFTKEVVMRVSKTEVIAGPKQRIGIRQCAPVYMKKSLVQVREVFGDCGFCKQDGRQLRSPVCGWILEN
jgi:hypothetical protein